MVIRLLVRMFGSVWHLKDLCQGGTNPWLKKMLINLYNAYQQGKGSSIAWNARFDGIPCLPHGINGIFISGGAKIGKNCVIFQQVTIGSNTLADTKGSGAPTIGNNCYIGAGAKIIGCVKVGDNVRIGANAVVYKDVPGNSVVTSGEMRIVKKTDPLDNRFFAFHDRWVYYKDSEWLPVVDESLLDKLNNMFS